MIFNFKSLIRVQHYLPALRQNNEEHVKKFVQNRNGIDYCIEQKDLGFHVTNKIIPLKCRTEELSKL